MCHQVDEVTGYAKFGGDRFMGVFWGDVHFLNYHSFFIYIHLVYTLDPLTEYSTGCWYCNPL